MRTQEDSIEIADTFAEDQDSLRTLLPLAGQFLKQREQEMNAVTDLLYHMEPPPAA